VPQFRTQVECHAGYKADEYPTRFLGPDGWVDVVEIADRWYQGASDPQYPLSDYFRVRGNDGSLCLLKHDREADAWFLLMR
jgi:hypothetical protein